MQIYEYFSHAANYRDFVMLLCSVNGNVILPRFSEEFRYHILMVNFLSFESIILSGTACFTASTTSFRIFSLT